MPNVARRFAWSFRGSPDRILHFIYYTLPLNIVDFVASVVPRRSGHYRGSLICSPICCDALKTRSRRWQHVCFFYLFMMWLGRFCTFFFLVYALGFCFSLRMIPAHLCDTGPSITPISYRCQCLVLMIDGNGKIQDFTFTILCARLYYSWSSRLSALLFLILIITSSISSNGA